MSSLGNNSELGTPVFPAGIANRRLSPRQKIHAPAYISVEACDDGTIFGLNEVYDIGTGGFCFQSSEALSPGSSMSLSLELSGAGLPVRASGRVIWSDPSGRTGIELQKDSLSAPRLLDEYLFLNALTACTHYESLQSGAVLSDLPAPQLGDGGLGESPVAEPAGAESPDYPAMLTWLAEVRGEVEAAWPPGSTPWQTVAERLLEFLGASGVAVAFSSEGEVICRASAGNAPEVGARFQSGEGFSGECIRSGLFMCCDDAQVDPRVDHEACLAMGIRSIIAAPIRSGLQVLGLIEVFSDRPKAFSRNSRIFLQRVTEIAAASHANDAGGGIDLSQASPSNGEVLSLSPFERDLQEGRSLSRAIVLGSSRLAPDEFVSSRLRRILILGGVVLILAAAALIVPWIRRKLGNHPSPDHAPQPSALHSYIPETAVDGPAASELDRLRELAEAGDASAQFALGARYATGDEVGQDYTSAARWFALAADQGHVVAQATLGAYYWAGRGVPEDLRKAYFWTVLAQAGGDRASKFRLSSLASSMSRRDVVFAQEEANEWVKRHQLLNRASTRPGLQ